MQENTSNQLIKRFQRKLIVSCQASDGEPLAAPEHICALALSAINGGAAALRLEGAGNVAFVRGRVSAQMPVVGLTKSREVPENEQLIRVYITPTFDDAKQLAEAGADIIALDCTPRPRPDGSTAQGIIGKIRHELGKVVWADCSTLDEGLEAAAAGAELISTTLSGYTSYTVGKGAGPDFELLKGLCRALPDKAVVMEGKIWTPEEMKQAFQLGAYAVVVGSAITRPQLITQRFVRSIPW